MDELSGNLLLTKISIPSTTTPTSSLLTTADCSPNIKERLNLHVKKRLQQEPNQQLLSNSKNIDIPNQQRNQGEVPTISPGQQKNREKEPPKARRPYQKRTDKTKSTGNGTNNTIKKYKRQKALQTAQNSNAVVGNAIDEADSTVPKTLTGNKICLSAKTVPHTSLKKCDHESNQNGAVDSQEAEAQRCASGLARDKDKCPDVLDIVLSMKKQVLLQDPEVQEFLQKIMSVLKD